MFFFDDDNPKVFFVFSYIFGSCFVLFFPDFGLMEGLSVVDQGFLMKVNLTSK